ncbi:MAG: ATP-dependent sacrificial sulfur transferase LarE [Oscillospiraceae bacterium]
MTLKDFFAENPKVALAFSGGADSAYLLCAGVRLGAEIKAYYLRTAFQPEFELADARRLAAELGAELEVVAFDILSAPGVAENPPDRCCSCKRAMFTELKRRASADGFPLLIDGTNASDNEEERPGMRALRELGVRSPLRDCGITKDELRRLSRQEGLFTWNKPAYSCLATRVAQGRRVTPEALSRIELAENAMFALGFSDFRVRVTDDTAKIQVTAPQLPSLIAKREEVLAELGKLFGSVTLDLRCR